MDRLKGKAAIVTGGAQGIGEGIARRLAAEGARVAILDVDVDRAQSVASSIAGSSREALALSCDVSRRDDVEQAMATVAAELGGIDILVSNAGVARDNLIHKMTDDDWTTVIDIHLRGGFLCAQTAQRYMVPRRYGKIVFISSRGVLGTRGQANYTAAKAGLLGMMRTLAIELGPFGINVNAIAPGHIDTPMTREVAARTGISVAEHIQNSVNINAIKRVGTPEDVGALAAFLVADESSYITGQVIYITGRPTV